MIFVSIDIETTGLNPMKHSVTEFAAVFSDLRCEKEPLTFYRHIDPEDFVWSQYCLTLHAKWLEGVLAMRKRNEWWYNGHQIVKNMNELIQEFCRWLWVDCGWPLPEAGKWKSIVAAGKNFNSFDRRFLDVAGFPPMFKHRALDPGMLYIQPGDNEPPSLELCKQRAIANGANMNPGVAHNALEDALDVMRLLQHAFRGQK